MMELVAPAGSADAVVAAVQSGADAIYLGFGGYSSRRSAESFSAEELSLAMRYCRVRGCKVYASLDTLVTDADMAAVLEAAKRFAALGAAALILQDAGLALALRAALPDMKLFAGIRADVQNLGGAVALREMGFSRVFLSRELNLDEIRFIAANAGVEIGVMVHGGLTVCRGGQCCMSVLAGGGSASRGECSLPCRENFSMGTRSENYPLSMKDLCLAESAEELEKAGVACALIAGRDRSPEYVAAVTETYDRILRDKRPPTKDELLKLNAAFSGPGLTDGYLKGDKADMFGVPEGPDGNPRPLLAEIRKGFMEGERRRVPVSFFCRVKKDEKIRLAVKDGDGNRVELTGPVPTPVGTGAVTAASLSERLYKTGGTAYYCSEIISELDEGLSVAGDELDSLRRRILLELTEKRAAPPERQYFDLPRLTRSAGFPETPEFHFEVLTADQLTPELAELCPKRVMAPLEVLAGSFKRLAPFVGAGIGIVAVLPRVITDDEWPEVRDMLRTVRRRGVHEALVGNIGHVLQAKSEGFGLRGDFGLNVWNSYSMALMERIRLLSATLSFELDLAAVRELHKPLDTELIVYGRLPVMLTEHCLIKRSSGGKCSCQSASSLSDRKGSVFPVVKEFGCRNVVLNTRKLYMADKAAEWADIGLRSVRLRFTTESAKECAAVAKSYLGLSAYRPNGLTRGMYYKK